MFLPTTAGDMRKLGWKELDIIIVSGDTYIDSSYNGAAVIGHWLVENGFKVGIICQPNPDTDRDITRLGTPKLFWSITAGSVDSMVANHTPRGKRRRDDDFTPGGEGGKRPDRACIVYTNLVRRHFKGATVVLGGIEASLRRVAHYDVWSDSVRRSVLFDAKADAITYGMAELSNLELAQCMRDGRDWHDVRGVSYIGRDAPKGYEVLPSFEECEKDHAAFREAFRGFYHNCDPVTAVGLVQPHGDRLLVQNPPQRLLTEDELDKIHMMDFEYEVHPYYARMGKVRAMDTIKNSITSHRGCYGECSFCAIAVHQGRTVVSRSEDSVVAEAERIAAMPEFNGIIYDVGGPTANMYGIECRRKKERGACPDRRCLFPRPCPSLHLDHSRQMSLLKRISSIPNVRKVFVTSGIRYDMVMSDREHGMEYLDMIVAKHVSGQLKIAPEHVSKEVLDRMGKPGPNVLLDFKDAFDESNERQGKRQFLTYYFMAAHPGCGDRDMREAKDFCSNDLHTRPEQTQIFTPTPSTVSTLMYHTRSDMNGKKVWSEHDPRRKERQKSILLGGNRRGRRRLQTGLHGLGDRPSQRRAVGRGGVPPIQGDVLPLEIPGRFALPLGIRLPVRCPGRRPQGFRRGGRIQDTGQEEDLRRRLHGLCEIRCVHKCQTPGLSEEEPEHIRQSRR